MLEVKHLDLIRAIHEHGTLSAAARYLGYSQPAVTQQLKTLERLLGTPLALRERSGLQLTEAGRVLLRLGDQTLPSFQLAEQEITALAGLGAGVVRIAAFPSAAATIVPGAMALMTDRYPAISFELTERNPEAALNMITSGDADIAIVFRYSSEPPFVEDDRVWVPLMRENVHVVLSRDHKTRSESTVNLRELSDARWIAGCINCRGHLLHTCAEVGFSPNIAFETDDYVASQSLAHRGFGVTLVPDLILSIVRLPGLRLMVPTPSQSRTVYAVTSAGHLNISSMAATQSALIAASNAVIHDARQKDPDISIAAPEAR